MAFVVLTFSSQHTGKCLAHSRHLESLAVDTTEITKCFLRASWKLIRGVMGIRRCPSVSVCCLTENPRRGCRGPKMGGPESQQFPSSFFPTWPPCSTASFSVTMQVAVCVSAWDRESSGSVVVPPWTHLDTPTAHSAAGIKHHDQKQCREETVYWAMVPEGSIMAHLHDAFPPTNPTSPKFHNSLLQTVPPIRGPSAQYLILGHFPFKLPYHVTLGTVWASLLVSMRGACHSRGCLRLLTQPCNAVSQGF